MSSVVDLIKFSSTQTEAFEYILRQIDSLKEEIGDIRLELSRLTSDVLVLEAQSHGGD